MAPCRSSPALRTRPSQPEWLGLHRRSPAQRSLHSSPGRHKCLSRRGRLSSLKRRRLQCRPHCLCSLQQSLRQLHVGLLRQMLSCLLWQSQ